MSQSNVPDWLSWVVPIVTAAAALWAGAKLLFVTRQELAEILEKTEAKREASRLQLHQENLQKFTDIFDRLGDVEGEAREIKGELKSQRRP